MVVFRKIRSAWGIARAYLRGWRTRRRIVAIENDDWGGIRTADRAMTSFDAPKVRQMADDMRRRFDAFADKVAGLLGLTRRGGGPHGSPSPGAAWKP